jgi:hypothetical protein
MRECTKVVRSHYRLWAWLWARRLRTQLEEVILPFFPMA